MQVFFDGANPNVIPSGVERLSAQVSFFYGNRPGDWKTSMAAFQQVRYIGLYPGIDLTYSGAGGLIKSEYVVAPGANPKQIRLKYSGARTILIDPAGNLIVRGGAGESTEDAPVLFQESADGARVSVSGRFKLLDPATVGFEVGAYDVSRPLTIDPTISYSTYVGGSGISDVTALAVDAAGNLYLTGWTESLDFPIVGAVQASNKGGVDAFVAKLNPAGNALVYATYIGGSGDDRAADIAVDSSGQAYVGGSTASPNFPLVLPIRSTLGGSRDAFALKLNAVGNALLYSTLLGGSNVDSATAIAVDSSGNAYIAGDTQSSDFPVLSAAQTTLGGGADSFVTKLTSAGALSYSTYFGGAGTEHSGGIAVDSSGNAYLAGGTTSTNLPLVGPIQPVSGGSQDAFAAKIKAGGSQILYSTYLGGSGGGSGNPEQANGIAVDSAGNAYIAGVTNSPNFPVTAGAFQTLFNGVQDAFVSKINPAGNALVYSTYLGGTSFDWAWGLAIDATGNAYVVGYTSSSGFPVVGAVQSAFKGQYDAFVSKISPLGNSLAFSTFYGGSGADQGNAIAIDSSGNMFIGGQTSSLDLPLQGAIQVSNVSGSSGWVARLGVTPPPPQLPAANSVAPSSGTGNTVIFTAQFSDTAGASALTAVSLLMNPSASTNYACYVTYTPSANQFKLFNDVATSGSLTVVPGGGSAQNSQCTLNGAGSGAVLNGNNLTLTVSLAFQTAFTGSKTVYLFASDANTNTGWVAKGTWSVTAPPPAPTANSVAPNAGSGAAQSFQFVFSDTQNAANLVGAAMLFSTSSAVYTNTCYTVYDATAGTISLLWDNATNSDSKPIASAAVLQNSQCQVGTASAVISGLSLIITVNLTFKGAFSGAKNIYMYGSESTSNTGWVLRGAYTVAAPGVPTADSVVPSSGSGPAARFSVTASDQGGANYVTGIAVLFAATLNTDNACNMVYDRTANVISLSYDIASHGAATLTPGTNAVISNSQCSLSGLNTTVFTGNTSVVLTLDLSFLASFNGTKNVYLYASEPTANSGWVVRGTWGVTGGAPTADSVTPNIGTGSSPYFTFSVSDTANQLNITGMSVLITSGSPFNTVTACYLVYNRAAITIGLYADNGTTLSTKPIGSSANLQNSQCAIGFTGVTTSGNSVLLTVNTVFKSPAFTGYKTIYLEAMEAATNSGWVSRGSWTVP